MEEDSMWECEIEYRLYADLGTRFTEKFLSRNPVVSIEAADRSVRKVERIAQGANIIVVGWTNKLVPLI
jgi:hypothetical protein